MSILAEWSMASLKENPEYYYCRNFPDLTPSPELSYMLGVRYGDLTVNPYFSSLRVVDKDFAEEFARCAGVVMGRVYEVKPECGTENQVRVYVSSKILSDFFKLSLEAHSEWIEPDYPAGFLRGWFDSEGGAYGQPQILVRSTNKGVLYYADELLKVYFGIYSSVTSPPSGSKNIGKVTHYLRGNPVVRRKVLYKLSITGLDDIEEFYWSINFSIARKSEVLERELYMSPHPVWGVKMLRE